MIYEAVTEAVPMALSIVAVGFLGGIWMRLGGLMRGLDDMVERVNRLEDCWFK